MKCLGGKSSISNGKTITNHGNNGSRSSTTIKGTVVLMKKNVLDVTDVNASVLDFFYEILGRGISFQLVSADVADPANGSRGKLGKPAHIDKWVTKMTPLTAEKTAFGVEFDWEESMGCPGAVIVKNHHRSQFYLSELTVDGVPGHGTVRFICNSWVYPARRYKYDRVFFSNKTYLPQDTPEPLRLYREEELRNLRGEEKNREGKELKEWDRVYDYAYYNDLGDPKKGPEYARPVLGGSKEYPYPRRGKTGRKPTKADPKSESRLPLLDLNGYVPRDERFDRIKFSDFLAYAVKALVQVIVPEIPALCDKTPNEFDTFEDVLKMYQGGIELPNSVLNKIRSRVPWEMLKELIRTDGEQFLKFPMPQVIKENKSAWRTDEEFGREMLAGVNPVIIQRLKEFPPTSKLDSNLYGNQTSTITKEQIEPNMDGFTVEKAIQMNRLFILDHHDTLMPYLERINNSTNTKTYATRTLLFLKYDGTLKPLAIELSKPHEDSLVFTPPPPEELNTVKGSIWQLAKAYAAVNDSGYHQLISHWLNTHATIEPFIIAANRHLSFLHPVYKLLQPHFRDNMHINALARHILINAGGILELTVYPAKFAMEMSSVVYKNWNFNEQALPADLLKRGVAVEDLDSPHGLKLLIEDYPFAVDGLEVWSAIKTWVTDYINHYYPNDKILQSDTELHSWWSEVINTGHGDKRDELWWPDLKTTDSLIQSLSTIIWVASALHAAVNFGQYPYAGYLPNRPTVSRRFMPKLNTPEYAELERDPDGFFLRTITAQFQSLLGVSLIEILSRHSTDEVYLGQRETADWTVDSEPLAAFKRFGTRLVEIEKRIVERNQDLKWKNRTGPVNVPYMLLYPSITDSFQAVGLGGRGIPNSVSI